MSWSRTRRSTARWGRLQATGRRTAAIAVVVLLTGCSSQVDGQGAPASTVRASTPTATVTVTVAVTVTQDAELAPTTIASSVAEGSITAVKHPDACSLLTQKEAAALADLALQPGVGAGPEHEVNTLCQYTRDPNLDGTAQVSIIIGDGAKKSLDIDKDTLKHKFVKVPGIGDEAWQEDDSIFLRVDTNWVNIGLVLLNDPAANVSRMRQAAKIVASRL